MEEEGVDLRAQQAQLRQPVVPRQAQQGEAQHVEQNPRGHEERREMQRQAGLDGLQQRQVAGGVQGQPRRRPDDLRQSSRGPASIYSVIAQHPVCHISLALLWVPKQGLRGACI